jgi:acetyl esterase/lipase/lysophospholipase L1-like esterase
MCVLTITANSHGEKVDVNHGSEAFARNKGKKSPFYIEDLLQVWTCGDSISSGYSAALKTSLRGKISCVHSRDMPRLFPEVCMPPYSGLASDVISNVQTVLALEDYQPDVLLLNTGIHDAIRSRAPDKVLQYEKDLETLVALAKKHKVRLIWIQTTSHSPAHPSGPSRNELIDQFNETSKRVMAKHNLSVIDLDTFTKDLIEQEGEAKVLLKDGIHFTGFARLKQGAFVADELLRLLKDEIAARGQDAKGETAGKGNDTLQPTHSNVKYGRDERNVMDVWLAEGEGPRPVVVFIHGGGWYGGNKDFVVRSDVQNKTLRALYDEGVSCFSIGYRLTLRHPLPAPVHDAGMAIQFIRSKAEEWNLDKERLAVMGGSAGGCTSLWLAFHDDLADQDAADPIARESTRVTAAVAQDAQSFIDPKMIEKHIGIEGARHPMICYAVGERTFDAALHNYAEHQATHREFSPLTHLTRDDPPVLLPGGRPGKEPAPTPGLGIHHGRFNVMVQEKSASLGHTCYLTGPGEGRFRDPVEFLLAMLRPQKSERIR